MFRTRNKHLPLITTTFGILLSILMCTAHAGDPEKAVYDKGFGEKDAAVRASRSPRMIAEFAGELLESAKLVREDQPYQAYLFNKSYEIGMLFPEGIPFAVEAMDQFGKAQPQLKGAADANLLNAMQKRYQTSGGPQRISAASAYIDRALQIADSLAAEGKYDEAVIICDKAKIALAASAARHNDVLERALMFKEEQAAARRIAALKAALKTTPHDAVAAGELVRLLMLDTDTPDQALPYVDATGDVKLKKIVALAAKDVATLTDGESLELGDWYRGQTIKAGKLASYTAWTRAKLCYQHFLDAHPKSDADRLNASRAMKDADGALAKLPAPKPISVSSTVQAKINLLEIVDPDVDAVEGKWKLTNGVLVALTDERKGLPRRFIEFPVTPPEEYDYAITYRYSAETECYTQVCFAGGHQFSWCVGAFRNRACWIRSVSDGKGPPRVDADHWLTNGQLHTSTVKVRRSGIEAYLDGKLVAAHKTTYAEMRLIAADNLRHGDTIGFGMWGSSNVTIESAELVAVTGASHKIRNKVPADLAKTGNLPAPALLPPAALPADPASYLKQLGIDFDKSASGIGFRFTLLKPIPADQWPKLWAVLKDAEILAFAGRIIGETDCVALPSLKSLRVLSIGGDVLSDVALSHIGECTRLERLTFQTCVIRDSGIEKLSTLTNLTFLNLHDAGITDVGISHLARIKTLSVLDVTNTGMTDQGLRGLATLPALGELRVSGTRVTAKGVEDFRRLCPTVKVSFDPSYGKPVLHTMPRADVPAKGSVPPANSGKGIFDQ